MSKSQMVPLEGPAAILRKELAATLELQWRVQQVRVQSTGLTLPKIRSLFDGMAGELCTFADRIQERLSGWQDGENAAGTEKAAWSWKLFAADLAAPRELCEALLSSYARYGRQTSKAASSLMQAQDPESVNLLTSISTAVDRNLWFLEIYLEGLALNTDTDRLPDWSPAHC